MTEEIKTMAGNALRILQSMDDENPHQNHITADALLCVLLEEYGHRDIVEAFYNIKKWYS